MSVATWRAYRPRSIVGQVSEAVRHLSAAHARRCAAWLLWHERQKLHARGAIYVHVPAGEEPPHWFLLAAESLTGCTRWRVSQCKTEGLTVYRIEWLVWRHHART